MILSKLKSFLDEHNVRYTTCSHSVAFTAQELAQTTHIPGKEIAIKFVGLRPGEKLEEELMGREENAMPSSLEKILKIVSKASVDDLFLSKVQEMAIAYNLKDHDAVIKNLQPR